jgi:hypothetical protein
VLVVDLKFKICQLIGPVDNQIKYKHVVFDVAKVTGKKKIKKKDITYLFQHNRAV